MNELPKSLSPRKSSPPPDPRDARFAATLDVPPLAWPSPPRRDPYAARRYRAEHLCLWMACSRVVCRNGRHCLGARADCVFEHADTKRPILAEVVQAGFGPR